MPEHVQWSEITPHMPPRWRVIGHPYPTPTGALFAVNVPLVGTTRGNIVAEFISNPPGIKPVDRQQPRLYSNAEARANAEAWAADDWEDESIDREYEEADAIEHTDRMADLYADGDL